MGRTMFRVMTLNEAGLLLRGKRNNGIFQPERAGDLLLQESRITFAGAIGKDLPEESDTKIAI